jgi:TolB protein
MVESPSQGSDIKFATWRLLKAGLHRRRSRQGCGQRHGAGGVRVVGREQAAELVVPGHATGTGGDLRNVAHQIADAIYQKITGVRGAFWTRIAYVTAVGLGNNTSPIRWLSLIRMASIRKWSRPNKRIAALASVVSGWQENCVCLVRERQLEYLRAGPHYWLASAGGVAYQGHQRRAGVVARWPKVGRGAFFFGQLEYLCAGHGQPSGNPDNHGQPFHQYPAGVGTGWPEHLFHVGSLGQPQIYQVPASGGTATRISFQGQNNQNVSVSYDGKQIAMVQGNGNVYRIAIADQSLGGQVRYVSPGPYDESPSFAPNASMLLYAATEGTRGVLYSVR